MTSEDISKILATLNEAKQEATRAEEELLWCNNATQDILHAVELEDVGKRRPSKTMRALREVRKRRREAKDTVERLGPVVEWMRQNDRAVKALERCLGETRKVEKRHQYRAYQPKTDVVETRISEEP